MIALAAAVVLLYCGAAVADDVTVVTVTRIEPDRVVIEQATVVTTGSHVDVGVTRADTAPLEFEASPPPVVEFEPDDE
jgi:hypothetical protein